jgi:tellurite resistance protein TehA-like permease
VAGLDPGAFAMVMATGILSTATEELGFRWLSLVLLGVAAAIYLVLCALTAWRLIAFPRRVLADAAVPSHAFAFFTFVAGSSVLGLRLAAAGQMAAGEVIGALAAAAWLLLSYAIPATLIASSRKAPAAEAVNGTWLLWVVGSQSVAGAAATFAAPHPPARPALTLVAVAIWGFGAVLYLLLMAIIMLRLLLGEVAPAGLGPPYWIAMGATAITVFVAARILPLPGPLPIPASTLTGLAFALWSFGTWWIPLLALLGVWRHLLKRFPLTYEPALWSMVFPLGMYAAASQAFGRVAGIGPLELVARVEVWFGLVAWAATSAAGIVRLWKNVTVGAR